MILPERPCLDRPQRAETDLALLSSKITTSHLAKMAIVYVRQSSTRQVRENVESTQLQYALVRRAKAYGWSDAQIETIDDDLGLSGQTSEGRQGFQRLLAEISLGHVGIVMGIEMSRLARNCRDWHHLLELCGVFGALLGDADGIYNPREHNDRLLLGLKGTMSEAELHVLRGRLDAGRRNKASRGEFFCNVPIGYVRTREGIALEPDEQAREVVRLLFDRFAELGSANAVIRYCEQEQIKIGVRGNGRAINPLVWRPVGRSTLIHMLHNPTYAGAYVFGRKKMDPTKRVSGKPQSGRRQAAPEEWPVLIRDKLPAYITWDQWEQNCRKLRENSTKFRAGPARGASLLAGRVVCGRCGHHMYVSYKHKGVPQFNCCNASMSYGEPLCQTFTASFLEPLVESLILKALEPASVELSLQAVDSIEAERERLDKHHRQGLERATYDAELARRRYEEVDPSNRLVAAELERTWERLLQIQRKTEELLNRFRQETPLRLTTEQRQAVIDLSNDFPRLWQSQTTTKADRQNIARLLIDRIVVEVLQETERLSVSIHWSGGYTSQHESRRPVQHFAQLEDSEQLVQRIQHLYNEAYPLAEIAAHLNREGFKPARGKEFTRTSVAVLCRLLRCRGLIKITPDIAINFWRASKLADALGIAKPTLTTWRYRGWVQFRQFGNRWIYWADKTELERLRRLARHPRSGTTPTPDSLIVHLSKMPAQPG